MPLPLAAIPALITAGTSVVNAISQGATNKKTREWNEAMYQRQRTDALADWARTNEYNAPLQQMARFKEAGLSPHLIYGGGANSISQPVRSTDTKSWSPNAPQIDGGQIVSQYFGVQQQQNALEIQKQQIAGLKLDNEYKGQTLPDRVQTPGINNAQTNQRIDNIMEDTRMNRLKQSLQAGEYDKLQEQVKQLVTSNSWLNMEKTQQYSIQNYIAEKVKLVNEGLINANNQSKIEAQWKAELDSKVGAYGPVIKTIWEIISSLILKRTPGAPSTTIQKRGG